MTATGLLLLAGIAGIGYWLGCRGAPSPRAGRSGHPEERADRGRPGHAGRSWALPVAVALGVVLVLGWLAPGPGLFGGPDALFGGRDGLFGPGGIFHDPPGPGR